MSRFSREDLLCFDLNHLLISRTPSKTSCYLSRVASKSAKAFVISRYFQLGKYANCSSLSYPRQGRSPVLP